MVLYQNDYRENREYSQERNTYLSAKNAKLQIFGEVLTNPGDLGYNGPYILKSCEKKSRSLRTVQRAPEGARGYGNAAEHGLGAGVSIGRHSRVRP